MSARDTQFKGFADLLFDELREAWMVDWKFDESMRKIIAQRAYDLAQHAVGYSLEYLEECGIPLSGGMGKRIQPSIPDLTELPKEGS